MSLANFVVGAFGAVPTAAPAVSVGVLAATAQVVLRVQRGTESEGLWWPPGLITGTVITHLLVNRLYQWAKITARTATQKPMVQPAVVIVFSGKRKSGKDYITDLLLEKIGTDTAAIFRLSEPLKAQYAKDHGLDLEKLLSAAAYKEEYRQKMIVWGEQKRNADPGYFARLATKHADRPIWIISDARRPTDIAYFEQRYPTLSVRVEASNATRGARGWVFTKGVDDVESECALDGREWDFVIHNDGNAAALNRDCDSLLQLIMLQARNKEGETILKRTLSTMRNITAVDRAQA